MTSMSGFIRGTGSSLIAQSLTMPLEVIAVKMQGQSPTIQGAMRADIRISGFTDAVKQIWNRDGVSGFFSGSSSNLQRPALAPPKIDC